MSEDPKNSTVKFSRDDIAIVDDFRKLTDTSVLTIMFTDIKGFTNITEEKGDAYANELRREHDGILVPAIEEDNTGKVIKHIGDAVMAIFAEPSVAVAKALAIQERLNAFNKEHVDLEDIVVRIGLHMGQVTTENAVDTDVFGRHVNRASRVEGLADGGQIYMTYPVFDSAKGWLLNREGQTGWTLHGYYYVKGIKEPIAIYEAYHADFTQPQPPKGAKKKRVVPFPAIAAIVALIIAVGVMAALLVTGPKPAPPAPAPKVETPPPPPAPAPDITFINLPNAPIILDHDEKIIIDGEPGQRMRKLLTPEIPPGEHVLHWTYSYLSRLYAHITVTEGENFIEPRFKRNNLPSTYKHVTYKEGEGNSWQQQRTVEFQTYDKENKASDHKGDLSFTISMKPGKEEDILDITYVWSIVVDGKEVSRGSITENHNIKAPKTVRRNRVVWKDDYHFYEISYYMTRHSTNFEIGGNYIAWLEGALEKQKAWEEAKREAEKGTKEE